jgi:hypothetical protein
MEEELNYVDDETIIDDKTSEDNIKSEIKISTMNKNYHKGQFDFYKAKLNKIKKILKIRHEKLKK